jgi:acetyl esterase
MTDYAKLIDAETWVFIDRTNSFYPPDAVDHSVEEQRHTYDRMCKAFHAGYPDGVAANDFTVETPTHRIPIRVYRNATPNDAALVLYFHGGGFILGGLDSHDDVCAEICQRTGYEVVSVDYRLVPEHIHPAAYDDCRAAFDWAAKTYGRPIVLCGDSAGGNLAAAVSHTTRDHACAPIGQVLIYPGLGGDQGAGSYVEHADAPLLSVKDIAFYREVRAGAGYPAGDATLEPLQDRDFAGLPPTVIVTAECDPLSSDGEAYRDRIVAAGGKAFWREEPRLVHSFLRARTTAPRAQAAFDGIIAAVAALGRGAWPY